MPYLYRLGVLAAALLVLVSSSCATVFTGTRDDVYFTSDPPGALVIVDGRQMGYTPCVVPIRRNLQSNRLVEYELPGYYVKAAPLESEFNWVTVINILWWPGVLIDLATGAVTRAAYDTYFLRLDPVEGED